MPAPARVLAASVVVTLAACRAPHARTVLEEEPLVLSEGVSAPSTPSAAGAGSFHAHEGRTRIALNPPGGRMRLGLPTVSVTVAGKPTSMVLDTGAADHLLHASFARGLTEGEASGRVTVIDHASHRVDAERLTPVSFAVEGWSPLSDIQPLSIEDHGIGHAGVAIGGILSPQRLAPGDGVVSIDFLTKEMVEEGDADGELRLGQRRNFVGIAPRCGGGYVLAATVDGKDASLLVDTGSFTTDLHATSTAGRALAGRTSPARAISGLAGPIGTRTLYGARIKAGKLAATRDLPVIDDAGGRGPCEHDGVLGMDVLARCALVIDPAKMRVACDE